MKALAIEALSKLGLLPPAQAFYSKLRSSGLTPWNSLVPESEFFTCALASIGLLKERGHVFGDYLEFGVSRGTSMSLMASALEKSRLESVRLIGFDSFEGMAKDAHLEGWRPGDFHSTETATRTYLRKRGVSEGRFTLVKGWFDNTLTDDTRCRLGLRKASLIMIDCDAFTPSEAAMAFVRDLILDDAIVLFDDWGWSVASGVKGQKEVFEAFLAEQCDLGFSELSAYRPEARVFHLTRR
jgi:hypothetical protein